LISQTESNILSMKNEIGCKIGQLNILNFRSNDRMHIQLYTIIKI